MSPSARISGARNFGIGTAGARAVQRANPRHFAAHAGRNVLFAWLFAVGLVNALTERVVDSLTFDGLGHALMTTFGVSTLIWVAGVVGIALARQGPAEPFRRYDLTVTVCAAVAFMVPSSPVNWIAVTATAFYLVRTTAPDSTLRRGGFIIFALTVPCFWSRIAFAALSHYILQADAVLVSTVIGTARDGNAVAYSDGTGYIWIAPGCSSLANVSLAILCWVLFSHGLTRRQTDWGFAWCLAACASVVVINVTRMALIARFPDRYALLHGEIGSFVAGWLILACMIGISALGVRRDLAVRA